MRISRSVAPLAALAAAALLAPAAAGAQTYPKRSACATASIARP
jgi:hypothetical protein